MANNKPLPAVTIESVQDWKWVHSPGYRGRVPMLTEAERRTFSRLMDTDSLTRQRIALREALLTRPAGSPQPIPAHHYHPPTEAVNTTTRLIDGADLALVLEAVENHEQARPLLWGLEAGTLRVAHTGPGLPAPRCCKAGGEIDTTVPGGRGQALLTLALTRAAGRWAAMGRSDEMGDCWRLVAWLRAGKLQLVGNHTASADMERWG